MRLLGFSVNQISCTSITVLKYLQYLYVLNVISIDKLGRNNLLFIKDLKIQNGRQSCLLIAAAKIVPCTAAISTILEQLVLS